VEPGSVVLSCLHVVSVGAVVGVVADVGSLWSVASSLGVPRVFKIESCGREFCNSRSVGLYGVGCVLVVCADECFPLLVCDSLGAVMLSVGAIEAKVISVEVAV